MAIDFKKILEGIRLKAADVAELTAKKTTEYSSLAKLSINQKQLESEISKLYTEIGKNVYQSHKDGTDAVELIAASCASIDEKNVAIAQIVAQCAEIRANAEAEKAARAEAKKAAAAEEAVSDVVTDVAEQSSPAEDIPAPQETTEADPEAFTYTCEAVAEEAETSDETNPEN